MSQSVKEFLEGEIEQKLTEAKSVTDDAEQTNRSLSEDERIRIEKLLDDVTGIKGRVKQIEDNEALRQKMDDMRGPVVTVDEPAKDASSIGAAFVKSDGYHALKSGGISGGRWTSGSIQLPWNGKATVTEAASPITAPDFRPTIDPIRYQRLTVADLIPQGATDTTTVTVIQETAATNAAAATAEAGQKQESSITFATVIEPVVEIATFLPVSNQMLEDVSQIQSYLNSRLTLFVQQKEEQQLLSGTGTAPELSGILDRAISTGTAASLDADSALDAVYMAMTNIRSTAFFEPDGLVVHPNDWAHIRLLKDDNDQYYGGGPFTGAYGNGGIARDTLWNLNVVVTTAMTQGTALIGAFREGAFIWRRSGLTVEASNSHADFFQYNKTAIRAEERLALGVLRPAAFYKVTGLATFLGS